MVEQRLNRGLFISHAHSDESLISALRKLIDECFSRHFDTFATSVIPVEGGMRWRDEIRVNLERADVVLVILTPQSFQRQWLFFEAGAAWLDAAVNAKRLIPCRFNFPDFSSTLSEFQGADLLDGKSIETVLISALARVSGLRPVERFLQIAIEDFLKTANELVTLSSAIALPANPVQEDIKSKVDMLIECIHVFFKDNPDQGIAFAKMLFNKNAFIDQDRFDAFLIRVDSTT